MRYSVRSVIGDEIERELVRRGEVPPRVFEFDGTDGVFSMVGRGSVGRSPRRFAWRMEDNLVVTSKR